MNFDLEPYEIVIRLVTGIETSLEGVGRDGVRAVLPGLQTNDVVKNFSIIDSQGPVEPIQFSLSKTTYSKWQ